MWCLLLPGIFGGVPKKGTAVNRSCSRTLIVAHEAIWEDLVDHFEIVDK